MELNDEAPALIAHLRAEIEAVDGALLDVLRRRAALSTAVAILKSRAGLPIHDPRREETLVLLFAPAPGPVQDAYREVIRVFRESSQRRYEARLPRPDDGGDPEAPA